MGWIEPLLCVTHVAGVLCRTALVCAIFGLDVDVADINTTNLPLISKTHPHHADIMKNILLVHPNLYVPTLDSPQYEIKGITPLCLASYLGKDELIQLLLEDGRVNVDGTDSKSATALMYAGKFIRCYRKYPSILNR